jgi:hypothetical protein
MVIIFLMLSPSTHGRLLQTKVQVQKALWSHCKLGINSLSHQQRWSLFNDHMQQDRRPTSKIDVCVWFCISGHEDMAALLPCSDVSMMTVICVCVILHISSWRYGRLVTLFWCINDDCNLCVCVILHLKRHAFVIISMQYNFLYDFLLTYKACDYLNSLAILSGFLM